MVQRKTNNTNSGCCDPISDLQLEIDQVGAVATDAKTTANTASGRVDGFNSIVNEIRSDIDTIENSAVYNSGATKAKIDQIATNQTQINTLNTDLSAAESDIDTLQTSVNELATGVSNLGSRVSTVETGKQDKLVAGSNISISSANRISAVDTKYTAGSGISISSSNVISATGGGGGGSGLNYTFTSDNLCSFFEYTISDDEYEYFVATKNVCVAITISAYYYCYFIPKGVRYPFSSFEGINLGTCIYGDTGNKEIGNVQATLAYYIDSEGVTFTDSAISIVPYSSSSSVQLTQAVYEYEATDNTFRLYVSD